ncbi:MAG: hypothetical protein V1720_07615 [bacterium]
MKIKIILLLLLLAMNCPITFTQERVPDVSLISVDALFVTEVIERLSDIPAGDGKNSLRVEGVRRYFDFDIKLQTIIHFKNDAIPFPIHVRLTSPNNISKIFTLEEDISLLEMEKIYDYDFGFQTVELGWFTIEIGIFAADKSPDERMDEIIFDKRTIFMQM